MRSILRGLFFAFALVGLVSQPSHAVSAAILTDAQIEAIQSNCSEIQKNLSSLHMNDAVLRVNLGQRYQNIARRLMAPLNSRIALNGLDGVALSQTTVRYNKSIDEFSQSYATYEQSVQKALDVDCRTEPIEFYSSVSVARVNRKDVAKVVDTLSKLGVQYRTQLVAFAKTVPAEVGE
ncbi:MAG TPA: hypothetical protein VL362_00505 [Patescibacteria group bacterium]|jgi:hypothetical protein|nr:hypothetical protein [Patescibacteria group bacterium]